jgi:hypothetical protein
MFDQLEVVELTSDCIITDDQCLDVQLLVKVGVEEEILTKVGHPTIVSSRPENERIFIDCDNLYLGKGQLCPKDCSLRDRGILSWFGKFKPSEYCRFKQNPKLSVK